MPESKEDKKKALESAIAHILKTYGSGAVMRLGQANTMQVDAIPTGSMTLDLALGIGGVPRGRIVELYGPESSGKTTVALHIAAEAQKQGGEVALIGNTWSRKPARSRVEIVMLANGRKIRTASIICRSCVS